MSLSRTSAALGRRSNALAGTVAIGGVVAGSRSISLWPWGRSSKPEGASPEAAASSPAVESTLTPAPASASEPILETATPSEPAPIPSDLPAATPPADISSIPDLDASVLLALPEQIGYLKALGLDFGWGPSSVVQWVIEHIHIWGGVPWWGSIIATALAIRVILWKPTLVSMDMSARMNIWRQRPEVADLQRRMMAASVSGGGPTDVMALRQRMQISQREAGVRPSLAFLGMLHLPAGFAMWRVISNMAHLPVPSMETGGMLWFTDLTAPDPYYILPVVGPIAMFTMMRVSKLDVLFVPLMASANPTSQLQNRYSNPAQQATLKIITWVLGPLSILVTHSLPAGVTFYFAVAAILGIVQSTITTNPAFRRWAALPPLPEPPKTTPGYQPPRDGSKQGTFSVLKSQWNQVIKDAQSGQGGMMERMQMKAAADAEAKAQEQRAEQERRELRQRLNRRKKNN